MQLSAGKIGEIMDIKILVAAHKTYRMPEDDIFMPVHVGAAGKESIGYQRDDEGENISLKNPYFCELTGLYWMWKNCNNEYNGLVHYRRYFATRKHVAGNNPFDKIIKRAELEKVLENTDIIVPKKRHYFIETLYSHYAHTHYASHLDITRDILNKKCSEYLPAFDKVMKRSWGYMFNMMIMKRNRLNEYCEWLFPILFELEEKVDVSEYDAFQARLFGRVSELLLNVWLVHNKYPFKEQPTITMEKLDWNRKAKSFLRAKFSGKKYDKSF